MPLQLHLPEPLVSVATPEDTLSYARQVLNSEAAALRLVAERLDGSFLEAVERIRTCRGRLAITGTGKSADVGQKLAGTLNSTGTRSYVLDATRAVHGDLGMVHPDDVSLILSHSGESEEIVRLLGPLRQNCAGVIALTGNPRGTLARKADVALVYGPLDEVCPLGLAPSASTTAMIALGDALAFVLLKLRQFTQEDFARYHPAGSLGRKLLKVENAMRQGAELRLAGVNETVREVFAHARRRGRRTGAVMLVDDAGQLCGLFTDSDLARLIEQRREDALDGPISAVMTRKPLTVRVGSRVGDAMELLRSYKISELPVVDDEGRPVGLLDITDLFALFPAVVEESGSAVA